MISTSGRSLFFVVAALTLSNNVLCNPLFNTLDNSSSYRYNVTGLDHFLITKRDLNEDRIVGGSYAQPGQFPFMAVVHQLRGEGIVSQCGGTILSQRWVLTAGHCVADQPRKFFVIFGDIDQSGIGYDFYQGPGIAMMTNVGALHPHYQPTINDVGLLYMPQDIPFGSTIQPIQLAGFNEIEDNFAGRIATVIGWGKDQSSGYGTKRLKYANVPIISNSECAMSWAITPEKHVCTAADSGEDACQGDSGGPLIIMENGISLQIGIVSYGDADCPSTEPGVFSRVTGYIDWIQMVTGLEF